MVPPPSAPRPPPPPDVGRRRRRPSGEPPPLPRDLRRSGRYWVALSAGALLVWFLVAVTELGRVIDRLDHAVLTEVVEWRRPSLDRAMRRLQVLGAPTTILVLRWLGILSALVFRRFRQLLVFLAAILFSTAIGAGLQQFLGRSRPLGVRILGDWSGFSDPSRPMVDIAVCLIGLIYLLVPRGEWRSRAKLLAGGYIGFLCVIHLYLAVDHPTDILFGVIQDGGGVVRIGRRLVKVPPRPLIRDLIAALASEELAHSMSPESTTNARGIRRVAGAIPVLAAEALNQFSRLLRRSR